MLPTDTALAAAYSHHLKRGKCQLSRCLRGGSEGGVTFVEAGVALAVGARVSAVCAVVALVSAVWACAHRLTDDNVEHTARVGSTRDLSESTPEY